MAFKLSPLWIATILSNFESPPALAGGNSKAGDNYLRLKIIQN
jgi:hypothetical protein